MGHLRKTILPIFLTGLWINISETIRWIFLIKPFWVDYYQSMNRTLPDEPINGIIWLIWGFLFATVVFIISSKFNLLQTTFLSWFVVFIMLWIVLWNLDNLTVIILLYGVPMSLAETFVAALICKRYISQSST